jgi:hypothetical protein
MNPDYVERTMSPGPARPPPKKATDDDEFNPRSGAQPSSGKSQSRRQRGTYFVALLCPLIYAVVALLC